MRCYSNSSEICWIWHLKCLIIELPIIDIPIPTGNPKFYKEDMKNDDFTWIVVMHTTNQSCPMPCLLPGLCLNCGHYWVDSPTLPGQSKVNSPKVLCRKKLSDLGLTAEGQSCSVWQLEAKCCLVRQLKPYHHWPQWNWDLESLVLLSMKPWEPRAAIQVMGKSLSFSVIHRLCGLYILL